MALIRFYSFEPRPISNVGNADAGGCPKDDGSPVGVLRSVIG